MSDSLPNSQSPFARLDEVETQYPTGVEGIDMGGDVSIKVVMKSDTMLMLRVFRAAGVADPVHRHDDHETSCHLVAGRLKVTVGDQSWEASPGDSWFHPKGVPHTTEALEDSIQIEVKSPPVKTWKNKTEN